MKDITPKYIYVYRLSDDGREIDEEKYLVPLYAKQDELYRCSRFYNQPLRAIDLRMLGFSELVDELVINTGLGSSKQLPRIEDDVVTLNLEINTDLGERIAGLRINQIFKSLDTKRVIWINTENNPIENKQNDSLYLKHREFWNIVDRINEKFKSYSNVKFQLEDIELENGILNVCFFSNERLFISIKTVLGCKLSIKCCTSKYELSKYLIVYQNRCWNLKVGNGKLQKLPINEIFAIIFGIPNTDPTIRSQIVQLTQDIFHVDLIEDDIQYDYLRDCYQLSSDKETELLGDLLPESFSDLDQELYKYTSLSTLVATLNSRKMRLNSIVGMNDKTETNFLPDIKKNFKESIESSGDEYYFANQAFITSFTTYTPKGLDMWRLYGDNGKGVCMVFKTKKDTDLTALRQVKYVSPNAPILKQAKAFLVALKKQKIKFRFQVFEDSLRYIKHQDFKSEKEIRLLINTTTPSQWVISSDNGILAPCIELPFNTEFSNAYPLKLVRIVLGPALKNPDIMYYQLIEMLRGIDVSVEIEKSKINTYR